MSNFDIVRAWKDQEYRHSLTEEQKNQLPENPAGMINLSDEQMTDISGGGTMAFALSFGSSDCRLKSPDVTLLRQDC